MRLAEHPGYFYPGEVVRVLKLRGIDYAQLRALLALVRPDGERPTRAWARFNLRDMACIRIAIDLAGGVAALQQGRRLRLSPLRKALRALSRAGYDLPLLDVTLSRDGERIIAVAAGVRFEAETGQLLLDLVQKKAQTYLEANLLRPAFRPVATALATERRKLSSRPASTRAAWSVEVVSG
jgi:hypothetical protein